MRVGATAGLADWSRDLKLFRVRVQAESWADAGSMVGKAATELERRGSPRLNSMIAARKTFKH